MDSPPVRARCDVAVTMAFRVLGKRWNGLILDALGSGALTFSSLRRTVGTISDTVLSERLVELTRMALVDRSVDVGPPVSVAYSLTPAGEKLIPVLDGLAVWAAENLPLDPDDSVSATKSAPAK